MREIYRLGIISALILITVLTSCKKEGTPAQQSTTLYLKSITPKGTLAYTKYGQVTGQSFVDRSAESVGLNLFYSPQLSKDYVTFRTDGLFQWGSDSFHYVKTNDHFVFSAYTEPVDSTNPAVVYAPFFKEPATSVLPNGNVYASRIVVANGDMSVLHISYMVLGILHRDSVTNAITRREQTVVHNEFNPEGAKTLGKNDTLAVRTYTFDYVKK
jgi:hypothetical protein